MSRRSPSRPLHAAAAVAALVLLIAPAAAAAPTPPPAGESGRIPDDRTEIVFVHTVGSSAAAWSQVLPFFQGQWRVWTYELPGHGRTPPQPGLSITAAAADLGAFLKREGIRYPVLVGHGMGGLIAMRYTFDRPADVRRLVVIDAAPRQQASQEDKERTARGLASDYDRWVAGRFLSASADSLVGGQVLDQALRTEPASLINLLMSSFDFDLTEELPRQSVPILVIGTAGFFPDPARARERLDQLGYGTARTVAFKHVPTGHFVMLERPVLLASVIMAFSDTRQPER